MFQDPQFLKELGHAEYYIELPLASLVRSSPASPYARGAVDCNPMYSLPATPEEYAAAGPVGANTF